MIEALKSWIPEGFDNPALRALVVFVGSLIVAKVVDWVLCGTLRRLARRTKTNLDEALIDALHRPIFVSVVLVGAYFALNLLTLDPMFRNPLVNLIETIAIIVWTLAVLGICTAVLETLSGLSRRKSWIDSRTIPLFDNVAKLIVFGGAVYFLFLAWNLNVSAWLASAGVVGLALGFAAKDSLANLFGGLFVIVDAPYKIGDVINLDSGERGEVTKIGLRSTRLLTRDDIEITVPNAAIAAAKIINESGGPHEKSRVTVTIGVAYGSDVDHVRRVLLEAATAVELVARVPEPRVRFTSFGDSALIFRLLCWVDLPVRRGACLDALNTEVYNRFRAEEISIPFPQREVLLRGTLPGANP